MLMRRERMGGKENSDGARKWMKRNEEMLRIMTFEGSNFKNLQKRRGKNRKELSHHYLSALTIYHPFHIHLSIFHFNAFPQFAPLKTTAPQHHKSSNPP